MSTERVVGLPVLRARHVSTREMRTQSARAIPAAAIVPLRPFPRPTLPSYRHEPKSMQPQSISDPAVVLASAILQEPRTFTTPTTPRPKIGPLRRHS